MTRLVAFLVHNWPLKLAALVLASLLYGVLVIAQGSRELPVRIEIKARHQPPTVALLENLGTLTSVRFLAPEGAQVSSGDFTAWVDLGAVDVDSDTTTGDVEVEAIDPRVRVIDFQPRRVPVRVEPIETRTVPIVVEHGPPPGNLRADPAELGQDRATVRGASSAVEGVDHVEARVEIEAGALDVDRDVPLVPVDASGVEVPQVDVEPRSVRVRIFVYENVRSKTVPVEPVLTGRPPPGFELASVEVDVASVGLQGEPSDLDAVDRAPTEPISLIGASSSFERVVGFELPAGVRPTSVASVRVSVTLRQVTGTRTFAAGVALDGPRADLHYDTSTDQVLVTVGGSIADLDRLEGRSFVVELPVAGLGLGDHEVDVTVDLPVGLTLVTASPPRVVVSISVPTGSPSAPPPSPATP